jgi:N-acetylneuraminate synthase/N,N'-diacetyllegionaminate synthase
MNKIKIGNQFIGEGEPCFIIAEAGVNHNGDIEQAKRLIDTAVESGSNAVKFQTFRTEDLVSRSAQKAEYPKNITDPSESQYTMIKKLELSKEAHIELMSYATKREILFLSTPFDKKSVDLLVEIGLPLIKVGSGEITNLPLLEYIASKNIPIILSTGMSTLDEVSEAVNVIKNAGCSELVLLHCTSNYPARVEDCNLLNMKTLKDEFGVPVGYSDHTLGIYVDIAAVAMGASVIEKHFTIDKNLPGPDHKASLEPSELKEMVAGIRLVETARGSPVKSPVDSEYEVRQVARKSVVSDTAIPEGSIITENDVTIKRPGTGISPKDIRKVIGKRALRAIQKDEVFNWDMIEEI